MESKTDRGPFAQNYLDTWSPLIGKQYAGLYLAARRLMLKGLGIVWLGMLVALGSAVLLAYIGVPGGEFILLLLFAPFLVPFIVGSIRQLKVIRRIQGDLEAAGFKVKPSGPDMRSTYWFNYWSKRSGITSEDIIRVGNKVFGENR